MPGTDIGSLLNLGGNILTSIGGGKTGFNTNQPTPWNQNSTEWPQTDPQAFADNTISKWLPGYAATPESEMTPEEKERRAKTSEMFDQVAPLMYLSRQASDDNAKLSMQFLERQNQMQTEAFNNKLKATLPLKQMEIMATMLSGRNRQQYIPAATDLPRVMPVAGPPSMQA